MIRVWLVKHRWVNELGKTMAAGIHCLFGYCVWEAGKLASLEVTMVNSHNLMIFGVIVGIMGTLALFIFVDVFLSVKGIVSNRKIT